METIMTEHGPQADRLLTSGEVADVFRVDARTVSRWSRQGRLRSIRTPGGQHRYRSADVRALLNAEAEGVPA